MGGGIRVESGRVTVGIMGGCRGKAHDRIREGHHQMWGEPGEEVSGDSGRAGVPSAGHGHSLSTHAQ